MRVIIRLKNSNSPLFALLDASTFSTQHLYWPQ